MRYILDSRIALRSWQQVPYAYYRKGSPYAKGLKKEEFELLRSCDGKREQEADDLLETMAARGFIHPCRGEENLTDWQKYRHCENRYFPKVNWMITGKCNYNCLHCFNAADNAPSMSEWLLKEAEKFLDEARKCGVNAFTITGGEPILHRNFMDILTGIYERGMYVEEINTNGYFLRQGVLDQMKERGIRPLMKISFDGIGHHDWLRGRKGAEEDAIRAIRLCRANDFPVMIQTNVHRHNLDTLLETAKLMDSLGVWKMRIIRTSEAPRWKENAGDAALGLTEYYDRMLEFASAYMKTGCRMDVIIWQFLRLYPVSGSYGMIPVLYREKEYRDSLPVCKGVRGMVAVAANGNIFPCHQLSGTYELNGDIPGNVKKESLKHLLSASQYLCEVCTTVDKIREHDRKCRNCKYFKYCAGGCRALAIVLTGDKLGADPSKCVFFGQGYYEKTVSALQEYENYTEIAYNPGTDI